MRKIFYLLIFLLTSSLVAEAQWTSTAGPFGGYVQTLRRSTTGTLYAVINQRLWQSTNSGTSWTQTSSSLYLNDIMIDSDGKLYAVYYSQLFVSADAGVTWTTVAVNLFQNGQFITKVGPAGVFVIWGYGGVYVSTNKGVAWTQISTLQWAGEPGLVANAAGDIFYATQGGKLWKHPYGTGTTWSAANMVQTAFTIAGGDNVNSMTVDNAGNLFVSSYYDFFISTNGGTSFNSQKAGLLPQTYFNGPIAASPDGTTIFFFSNIDSKTYKSTNQITSWTSTPTPTASYGSNVRNVVFASASNFFVGSDGDGIFSTIDTGANWLIKSNGLTAGNANEIEVANSNNKIILVKNGRGYYSSADGGTTWAINPSPGTPTTGIDYISHVMKLADGTLLLYGSRVFKSIDNGATWTQSATSYGHARIVEAASGELYGFSYTKITKSVDKGITWTDMTTTNLPANFSPYYAAFDGTTNMMVYGYDNTAGANKTFKVAITGASTATATLLTTPYTGGYNNVFFQNNKFYLSQYSAFYYTSDLGTTWTTVGFSGNAVMPITKAPYSGVAVSKNGSLYISQDDGGSWNSSTLPNSNSYITDIATDASGNYYASAYSSAVLKNTSQLLVDPLTLPAYINFNWQALNGPYGGRISKIELHPDGITQYVISSSRLWKFNGTSWSKIDPVSLNGSVLDVEIDAAGNVYVLPAVLPQKIYKSTNGTSWSPLTSTGLPAAGSTNMSKLEILSDGSMLTFGTDAGYGRIYKSTDGGANFGLKFTSAYPTITNVFTSSYTKIPIVNPVTPGIVATYMSPAEGMVVSTDFGTNWTPRSISAVADPVNGFVGSYMYDKNGNIIMHVIVDTSLGANWVTDIVKSADNGTTWTFLHTPSPKDVVTGATYSKRIVTLGTGEYLMTIQTAFDCYRSADGGATWQSLGNVGDIFLWTATKGTTSYILGNGDAGILKTTDGGLTFTPSSQGMPHPSANEIQLLNSKDLLIGATRPFYSSDFGQNFTLATLQPAAKYLPVGDSLIGYGSRLLLKSKDGGKTWASFGTDRILSFLTKDATGTGFYGSDGTNLVYSTNLVSWTNIVLSGLPSGPNGYFISSMVIDQGGVIYAVVLDNDTGANDTYKIVFGSAIKISSVIGSTNPANIRYINSKIYLYDTRGIIYKSTDGETWTQGSAPAGNSLVVTSNNYLFIPANSSVLWLSRNDGVSWQSVGDVPPTGGTVPVFKNVVINEYDGYAYATLTNSVAKKSANMVIPDDKTKPVVTAYSPLNSSTGASVKPVLSITFDEITKLVPPGKFVRIFDVAAPALPVATMDMSTATQSGKTWSIVSNTVLAFNKTYFVVIDAGAVTDIFGNTYNGISVSTTWRFTTKSSPVVSSLSPVNAATNVSVTSTFAITFPEPVQGMAAKNLVLYKTSAPTTAVATLAATAGVSSGNVLTYTFPAATLVYNTAYFIKADASAFTTVDGGVFSALTLNTDWTFTTIAAPDTQAPTITFVADPLQKSAGNKVFAVTISDNIAVASAKISYRSITSNNAVTTANLTLNGSTGKYEVTIPEAAFGPMGLEFYFNASDAVPNTARSPLTGNYYSYITYPAASSPTVPGALVGVGGQLANWRIISIPFNLSDNRISTVFSELGTNDNSKWRLVTYKSTTAWNEYPTDFSTFTEGKGYFINMVSPTSLIVEGATTPSFNKESQFSFTLVPGWNQIGNPYTYPMKWSEVMAANSNPAGIATSMKLYKGTYADGDQLEVFEGGFVLNSGAGNVTMTVPVVGTLAGGRTSSVSYDLNSENWVAPITIKINDVENSFGGVGMNTQASVGVDVYDDFNPPSMFDYAQLNFSHPEHFLKQSTRDVVPTQQEYAWEFSVESNQQGKAQLLWNRFAFGANNKDLYLLDKSLQQVINMREVSVYNFNPAESTRFKIYFGADLKDTVMPERVSLGNAYPNPTNSKTVIPFTLPESNGNYQVKIEVYNMVGQKVSTLAEGQFKPGFYQTEWDASEAAFNTGLYTYRLVVSGENRNEALHGKVILKK